MSTVHDNRFYRDEFNTTHEAEAILAAIRSAVGQYREAPFRSAEWLACEVIVILNSAPVNVLAAADRSVERLMALTDEQIEAEACEADKAWAAGMKLGLNISKEWCLAMAQKEEGSIGAGAPEHPLRRGEARVEAVARAIAEARHGVGVWNEHNMNEVEQNDFRHQARAAIRAKDRHPLCATCNDTGAVGRAPDDYSSCPVCNSGSEIAEAEREACIAILEDLRPKNDRSDWTEYAQGRDAVLCRAIAEIAARYEP